MASYEEKLEMVENALARAAQLQAQGEAKLEQALKRVEELIPAAGEVVADAMKASADQAAEAHQVALMRVVDEVSTASKGMLVDAAQTAKRSEDLLGRLDQASQRMVGSEQKVEAALDGLLPKVATIREGLDKELADTVRATAVTEEEIKKMVAAIRSSMTKEIEGEIRAKLHEAATLATSRIYSLGDWWERFTKVGIPLVLVLFVVVSGGLGWWFGQHQMKGEARQEALKEVAQSLSVRATAYSVVTASDGGAKVTPKGIREPLVVMADGSYRPMKRTADGKWSWGKFSWNPDQVSPAMVWDEKTNTVLKIDLPE